MTPEVLDLLVQLASLHDDLGKELDAQGGVLRCENCRRQQPMRGASRYLLLGWPRCCGCTMLWERDTGE